MRMTDTMARVALERSEDSLRKITTATILERPVELSCPSDQQSPHNVLACCEDSQAGTITTESLHDDTMITHLLESLFADTSESMTMSQIQEPGRFGDDGFREYKEREWITRRRRNSSGSRSRDRGGFREEIREEIREEKPYPRRGKTRMPKRLVHTKSAV